MLNYRPDHRIPGWKGPQGSSGPIVLGKKIICKCDLWMKMHSVVLPGVFRNILSISSTLPGLFPKYSRSSCFGGLGMTHPGSLAEE